MSGPDAGVGLLVLVVGASGTGKDSLLREIERQRQPGDDFLIMQRHITRPPEPNESHIAVSGETFDAMQRDGAFSLIWHAHGLSYGIGRELDVALAAGRCCIASVSRTVVADARRRFGHTLVVEVTVPEEVRAQRLMQRAREEQADIRRRLERRVDTAAAAARDVLLDNSGPIGVASKTFLDLLAEQTSHREDVIKS